MTPEPGWYPLALAQDVETSTAAGTRLFGRELVVWRDDAGQAHVWEDRCPHRGMRLSFGFVRGARLACLYHGWQFDGAGHCRYVPAHPQLKVPATITVERCTAAERLGVIWVFWGDDAASTSPPGGCPETVPVRSLAVNAAAARVTAALMAASSPFDGGGTVSVEGACPLLTITAGAERLYAAVQPTGDAETTLHLVAGPSRAANPHRMSLWAEALRRQVEADAFGARPA